MKFSINQNEFNSTLGVVSKGAAVRSTLPILSGILIKAENNNLVLEATDIDKSIRCICSALIEEEGQIVIPAKLLSDVVKNLPNAAIHFSATNESATILCDNSSFSLKALDAIDFPGFPEVELQNSVDIPFKAFSSVVKKVARSVSRDDSRPILSGVLIHIENSILKMVATDSYRLALEEIPLENSPAEFSAVIPGIFLNDLSTLSGENEYINLSLSENQVIAKYGSYIFINRKIEGNYPNYNQLFSDSYPIKVCFNTEQLLSAVKRVSLVTNNTSPICFNLDIQSQTVQLSSTTQDVGAAQETISASIEGENTQIAFNGHYLLDGLNSIDTEQVILNLQTGVQPGVFRAKEGNFIYLIMPVRLS